MKLLVLLGFVVYSASQKNFIEQWFTSMDTNHDDLIEKGEIRAAFDKFDLNGNGKVNFSEYSHTAVDTHTSTTEAHGAFNYYDKIDGTVDGLIDDNIVAAYLKLLDANGDSQVTRQEFDSRFPTVLAGIQAEVNKLQVPVGK